MNPSGKKRGNPKPKKPKYLPICTARGTFLVNRQCRDTYNRLVNHMITYHPYAFTEDVAKDRPENATKIEEKCLKKDEAREGETNLEEVKHVAEAEAELKKEEQEH